MKVTAKIMKIAVFVLFSLALVLVPVGGRAADAENIAVISVEKNPEFAATLRELELDLLFEWEGRIYVLVRPQDLGSLDRSAIPYVFETHRFPALKYPQLSVLSSINGEYHSYKELEADLTSLEAAHPNLAKVYTIGTSLESRKIYALKISDNVSLDEEEAEVLFLGCHHAREWISVEVPYLLGKHLLESYDTDAEVRRLVDESEIWIVPMVNPDGLEYTIHYYRYWRKNRRLNADGSYGVDINRNYGYGWGFDDEGSSPEPDSAVYRGPAAFSEPETRAVRDLFLQKNFRAMITYHSYSQVILYPWGYTTAPPDKDALLRQIASRMSALMEPVNGRFYEFGQAGAELYLTNGTTDDWTFATAGIPSYTIELPPIDQLQGGFFNPEEDIQTIFRENLPAALYLIDWSIQNLGFSDSEAKRDALKFRFPHPLKSGIKNR